MLRRKGKECAALGGGPVRGRAVDGEAPAGARAPAAAARGTPRQMLLATSSTPHLNNPRAVSQMACYDATSNIGRFKS